MTANRPPREGQAGVVKHIADGWDHCNVIRFPLNRVTRHARQLMTEPEYLGWPSKVEQANREARANPTHENVAAPEALAWEGAQWSR